jgi:ABC-type methionine transport system ATPase subunit
MMTRESHRYWLSFSAESAKRPLIWKMARKFDLVFNVRSASVTEQIGLIALELTGERRTIEAALKWLRRNGVEVDPIELNIIES